MSVNLMPTWQIGDVRLTEYPYSVDRDNAVEIGEPAMVVESLASMLADGDIDRVVRHGNRVYVIPCYVEGADLMEVAQAEATLRAELTRSGLVLTHDPGDGFAPASAYDVLTAQMTPERNDTHESHLIRKWTLTLTCAPFARSVDLVTVEALEVGVGAPVVVDDCTSTTGWTGTRNGNPESVAVDFWDAGSVGIGELTSATEAPEVWTLTRTGAVDFSTTPYLVVRARTFAHPSDFHAYSGATATSASELPILEVRDMGSDELEYTFLTDGGVVDALTFRHTSRVGNVWQALVVYHVTRTGNPPGTTARQLTRIIETGGTERTPASLYIEAPDSTSSLLTTLVHTSPEDGSGYSPPLRRWRVSGNTVTTDSSVLSGAYESLTPNPFAADVPISSIPHDGYIIAARVFSTITQTVELSWSVTTIVPGYPGYPGPLPADSGETTVTLFEDMWAVVGLGVTTLPTMRTTAMDASVRVIIGHPAGDSSISIDEGWIFRAGTDCALTVVEGIFRPLLRLGSSTADSPVPTVLFGDANATIHPGGLLKAMGHHVLAPSGTAVFTATEGVTNPATSATFHRRWHSSAAE